MPSRYLILEDPDLLYLEYSGGVTRQEQGNLMMEVLGDPAHRCDMPILSHTRSLTGTELDFSSLMSFRVTLARAYATAPGPVKCALLAPDDLAFGMARMVQALLSEIEAFDVAVFRGADDALDFLDLRGADALRQLGLGDTGPAVPR